MRMTRSLLYVPRMYTREELLMITPQIPPDLDAKTAEFWKYVEEKIAPFVGKAKAVYHDMVHVSGDEGLKLISTIDEQCYPIVRKLTEGGAMVQATEDVALLSEAESWVGIMRDPRNRGALELFVENLKERNRHISETVEKTLQEGETGVIFIEPSRQITFPKDITVIRVCPFEPTDYVNGMLARQRVEKRQPTTAETSKE